MSKPDTWRLISVLFSDRPLSPALAMTLYETAAQLHRDGATSKSIAGDTLTGRVRNLRSESVLGTLSGPTFEARIEADEGDLRVRYILTDEGQCGAKHRAKRALLN